MTNKIWMATCSAIVGCAVAAMAQTAPPSSQTTASKADRKITVTGCLAAAPATSEMSTPTPTGTAGTAGTAGTTATGTTGSTAAASVTFQLTNATVASADSSPSDTAATATEPASAPKGQTYRLIANPTALTAHVGKKLALTGTLEDSEGAPASTTAAESAARTPALRVESGKIVAESCSQ